MTIAVAATNNGRAIVAADSQAFPGGLYFRKIAGYGDLVIGATSGYSCRTVTTVLRQVATLAATKNEWNLATAIRDQHLADGWRPDSDCGEQQGQNAFVWARGDTVGIIDGAFAPFVMRPGQLAAVGHGADAALGAWHALRDLEMPLDERLRRCVQAAIDTHPGYCGGEVEMVLAAEGKP